VILSEDPGTRAHRLYWGLAGLLCLVWLATLAGRPLFNPDEARYAEIPREMLSGGDWVIPHLNGLDYIEKPPLQYWATAASYGLLGVSEFSARLYTALTALATIALIGFLAARLSGNGAGWRAAAVLSGMFMFVVLGQLMTLDMSLTFWMSASLAAFLLAQQAQRARQAPQAQSAERGWMLFAWLAAALGVLTKGLVAAGHELEHHGDRELVQLFAQFREGRVVPVVQRVKRLLAPFPVIRGLDDDPGEELPGLDFRGITVPKHRDVPDRALREPAAHLLVELLPYLVKVYLFHDRLREFRM